MGRLLQQVLDLEADAAAELLDGAPSIVGFLEPADHLVDPEAALDLELAILAFPRTADDRLADVGS